MALLFGSLPLASRLFLGAWDFAGAADLSGLCVLIGIYFHVVSRRFTTLPDPSSMLDEANRLAAAGRLQDAIALLSEAVRLSPQLWQAFQYRGELYMRENVFAAAVDDFTEAIRLAPGEAHLFAWRGYARTLLGDTASATRDYDTAAALSDRSSPGVK
jgi:tetratricopeptide (TPR) repeat protein